jgi:hypothetical protein
MQVLTTIENRLENDLNRIQRDGGEDVKFSWQEIQLMQKNKCFVELYS